MKSASKCKTWMLHVEEIENMTPHTMNTTCSSLLNGMCAQHYHESNMNVFLFVLLFAFTVNFPHTQGTCMFCPRGWCCWCCCCILFGKPLWYGIPIPNSIRIYSIIQLVPIEINHMHLRFAFDFEFISHFTFHTLTAWFLRHFATKANPKLPIHFNACDSLIIIVSQ